MQREEIAFVGTSDLSGHFRGKSFPTADLAVRLQRVVGPAPTNIFLSALGPIQYTAILKGKCSSFPIRPRRNAESY